MPTPTIAFERSVTRPTPARGQRPGDSAPSDAHLPAAAVSAETRATSKRHPGVAEFDLTFTSGTSRMRT